MSPSPDEKVILVVSDDVGERQFLQTILQECGYTVHASGSNLAVARTQTAPPHVIALAEKLNDMDSFQLCNRLRFLDGGNAQHSPPVVFIAANENKVERHRIFAAGAADYITKPFLIEEIVLRIEHQLDLQLLKFQLDRERQLRREAEATLRDTAAKLDRLSKFDDLTQLHSSRYFLEALEREWRRSVRDSQPLSLVLVNIDYFREYNNARGRTAGDRCLQQVGEIIRKLVHRPSDVVARYGDEEFALLLPNTDTGGAIHVSRKLQVSLQAEQIPHPCSPVGDRLTLSIGIAGVVPRVGGAPPKLVDACYQALNEARRLGRNRIILKSLNSTPPPKP
ncbi:MAG: diguanylate cyclase [Oscillatoriales cyanobacterium SM2_1_8]|nr:diguanylate cyclase [Oscillatoriales cyanobacterium SM2_1_8]